MKQCCQTLQWSKYVSEHFKVVQYNLYGDEEVIDLDGEVLTEKTAAEKWGIMFTPTWLFLPVRRRRQCRCQ